MSKLHIFDRATYGCFVHIAMFNLAILSGIRKLIAIVQLTCAHFGPSSSHISCLLLGFASMLVAELLLTKKLIYTAAVHHSRLSIIVVALLNLLASVPLSFPSERTVR